MPFYFIREYRGFRKLPGHALREGGHKLSEAKTLEEENMVPVILVEHKNAKWLLVSIDPDYPYLAYGLCDLGMGYPELGSVELQPLVDNVCRSLTWDSAPKHPIMRYVEMAHKYGRIVLETGPDRINLNPLPVLK